MWDLAGNNLVTFPNNQGGVKNVAFILNGSNSMLIESVDGVAHLLGEQGKKIGKLPLGGLLMSPGCKTLLTLSDDELTAFLYDTVTGEELAALKGHTEKIISVRISSDGDRILTDLLIIQLVWGTLISHSACRLKDTPVLLMQ